MGLLDDAIREHLELKRRHGADPDEVSRQEEEVLGAAQGAAEFAPSGEGADPEAKAPAEPEAPADEIEPPPEPEEAPTGADEDPWLDDGADEVPADDTLERPAAIAASEPEPEPEPDPEAEPAESEDVLEETPEFLQETPEHDRLWFEQRPPRDFDWDK